jgi:hypothetical protein
MTKLLPFLGALALTAAVTSPASAQVTFDTVDAFLARAATSPSLQAGADVRIRKAVVATPPRKGGELPERWVFADYPGTGTKSWRDPFVQFDLARAAGSPGSLRVHLVTQQWQNSYDYDGTLDDILVVDTEHQTVQVGYTVELRGRVVYDRLNRRFTLFPRVRRSSADEGLRVTGSIGAPVVPELRGVYYADDVVASGGTVRLEGYGLDRRTKVYAGAVELPVLSAASNGKQLTVRVPANAPHGVVALSCKDALGRAGLGAPALGINQAPAIGTVSALVAGGKVTITGRNVSNVSSMAELAPSTFGLGLQAPDVTLGGRSLRVLERQGNRIVCALPADLVLGEHDLVVSNDGGASAPRRVRVVAGTTGIVGLVP